MTAKYKTKLLIAKEYCQANNGLPYCKNCGIDFDELLKDIQGTIARTKENSYAKGVRDNALDQF